MPEGAVIEPRHETTAAWLLLAWLAMGVVGIVTVIGGISAALIVCIGFAIYYTARWVFGI